MTKLILIAFGATAALVGCGGNKVDELYDNYERLARQSCECTELTMMTEAMCVAAVEAELPNDAERDCLNAAYDRNKDAIDPAADCLIDVAGEEADCIDRATCNAVAIQTCLDAAEAQLMRCPEVPSGASAELSVCLGT